MKRYVYYLIITNILAFNITEGHKILLNQKEYGALQGMILSIVFGFIILFAFVRFFQRYPGKDLPDLMLENFPKLFSVLVLLAIAIIWFIVGLISLVTFTFTLKRFLTPESSTLLIASIFLIFITYGIFLRTKSVLYTIEIVLLMILPVDFFLILKSITSNDFKIDFVSESIMHINHLPNFTSISTALYIYFGIVNLLIFNNQFQEHEISFTWKDFCLSVLFGFFYLLVGFFIPIGLLGYDNIGTVTNPIITATDALRMPLGIIERVLFITLTEVIFSTFICILLQWHVVIQILKKIFKTKKFIWHNINFLFVAIVVLLWGTTIYTINVLNEYSLLVFVQNFFYILPFFLIFMLLLFYLIKRRQKQ